MESSGMLAGLGVGMFLIYAAVIVLMYASLWKIFTKAGKPGWAAIIPIYNYIVYLEVVGKPWWWLFLFCIPFVNFIFLIWALNLLSLSFGKTTGFTIGLLILPIIFFPVLAFGDAAYKAPAGLQNQSVA